MPSPAAALSILMMLSGPQGEGAADIHKVACRVVIDGVCRVETGKTAGNGGAGGNATVNYNFYLGGPTAGNGGAGGSVKTNTVPAPAAVAPAPASVASGPPVSLVLPRCKLTIAGKPEVDAKSCRYEKVGREFTLVAPSENQKYTYTIKVALNEDKTGQGSLSGGRSTAVRDLGKLIRKGACWAREDQSVEICAWK